MCILVIISRTIEEFTIPGFIPFALRLLNFIFNRKIYGNCRPVMSKAIYIYPSLKLYCFNVTYCPRVAFKERISIPSQKLNIPGLNPLRQRVTRHVNSYVSLEFLPIEGCIYATELAAIFTRRRPLQPAESSRKLPRGFYTR